MRNDLAFPTKSISGKLPLSLGSDLPGNPVARTTDSSLGARLIFKVTKKITTVRNKLNKIQQIFNESAGLSGFAVKNSAEKICAGCAEENHLVRASHARRDGLVFARFFLLNLGKPTSDGDSFASFLLKKRREK
ncbi:MAG: hypothetical protein ABIQ40_08890 [Bacteroidia bacterium]